MGVFADVLAAAKTLSTLPGTEPNSSYRELESKIGVIGDPDLETEFDVINAVHNQAVSTQTSGNHTLTFVLANGETFTTGNIAFNAAASAIETANDSAATSASITGWTNGDISVSGGAVNVGAVVYTYDGASVAGSRPTLIVLNDVDGAGGAWGALSITTAGQSARKAWATLNALGVVTSKTIPAQGSSSPITGPSNIRPNFYPSQTLIKALAEAAADEDTTGNVTPEESKAIEDAILSAAGISA